ncbi:delta-9 desaturase-like protein [Haematococcus lacustris]
MHPTRHSLRTGARGAQPASTAIVVQCSQRTQMNTRELVVERVSNTAASRKGVSQAFTRLLGLRTVRAEDFDPTSLDTPPYPPYTVPLSSLRVQRLRPYLLNRTFTDTDAGYGAFFIAMHAAALVGGPLTFSGDALQVALVGYMVTGMLGISMSYHRQLTHKSFRCPKWLEFSLAYAGVLAFEGDPVEWSKNHRWHHLHSDTSADRHSPRDGLWHAHMGWLFDEQLSNTRKDVSGNMRDSLSPPWFFKESPAFYTWLRETYMWHQVGQALLLLAWGGLPYFIWGFVIRILVTMHMTWLVNSAVHIWGSQPYDSGDNSRNNPLVALLVFGDGWHNNHHAFEYSAAHGLEWWQVDFSYYLLCCLERVGLAWDVRRPSLAAMAAKRRPAV